MLAYSPSLLGARKDLNEGWRARAFQPSEQVAFRHSPGPLMGLPEPKMSDSSNTPRPAPSTISKVVGLLRAHGRFSPKVGSVDTRALPWLSVHFSRALNVNVTANDVRTALGVDARGSVDLAGNTNVKHQTLAQFAPPKAGPGAQ